MALAALIAIAGFPAAARAHGPVAPVASSYLAKVADAPAGVEAKVVDGDQRMWLRVSAQVTLVVPDYRGAPYLRFSRSGVQVNRNSAMYYLNLVPAETPPPGLSPAAPASWHRVSSGHEYGWHDGRLHALATTALAATATYVGRWSIPVRIDGRRGAISGSLWHAGDPSIVWFWPAVVLVACVLAARRLQRPELDERISLLLAVAALAGVAVGVLSRGLYGRPTVSVGQLVVLGIELALVSVALARVLLRRARGVLLLVISFVAMVVGGGLVPTLLNGFVLTAVPPFATRLTAVVCIGSGAGLFVLVLARIERTDARR